MSTRPAKLRDCCLLIQAPLREVAWVTWAIGMRNGIGREHLNNPRQFDGWLLLNDESGVACANDWANGFLRGMEMRRHGWADLMDDEEQGGSLVPILALAHEHHPDPEMRPHIEPISTEMREKLIVGAAAGVMAIYDYFEAERVVGARRPGSGHLPT